MDKEIKEYIDAQVKIAVKEYMEHEEENRREIMSKSQHYKSEIRKLILANAEDAKQGYGLIYKKYNEDTGDNTYLSAKEKGLSTIDYISQFGDIKHLYAIALAEWGENKLPTESELEKTLPDETVF